MEVKTFTYKKMLNTFYLQKFLSNKKMDDHIAEMLSQGWEILGGPVGGKERAKGIGLPGDTMTITFKKG